MTDEVKNIFSPLSGENGSLVVIPPNYLELGTVPICIRTIDDQGKAVYRGWIEAVTPVADTLRTMARTILLDIWRVSELAEGSVHSLSARFGEKLGLCPHGRIYIDARWRAHDLAAGSRRTRVKREVELPDYMVDERIDPHDFERAFEAREIVDRLEEQFSAMGLTDALEIMRMYTSDCADEIPKVFGIPEGASGYGAKNTLFQQFRRDMRRAFARFSKPPTKRAA